MVLERDSVGPRLPLSLQQISVNEVASILVTGIVGVVAA